MRTLQYGMDVFLLQPRQRKYQIYTIIQVDAQLIARNTCYINTAIRIYLLMQYYRNSTQIALGFTYPVSPLLTYNGQGIHNIHPVYSVPRVIVPVISVYTRYHTSDKTNRHYPMQGFHPCFVLQPHNYNEASYNNLGRFIRQWYSKQPGTMITIYVL